MRTERIQRQSGRFGCWLLVFMLLVALTQSASAEIIPSARRIPWQGNVGVQGGISTRTTIYTTITATSGDRTSTIQTAINNCPSGQVVLLGPGTFNITGIKLKSNVTLRGSGMGVTTLYSTSGDYAVGMWTGSPYPDYQYLTTTARDLTSGYTKGSTSITTSVAHGWSVGNLILIDQLRDPSGDPSIDETLGEGCTYCGRVNGTRPIGQINKVTATPTSNTATLEIPLYWNYDATKGPQAIKLANPSTGMGLEDLTVDTTSHRCHDSLGSIVLWFIQNSWLSRVELKGVSKSGIRWMQTYRNSMVACNIHTAFTFSSNNGYGMWFNPAESANLIEDNIFHYLTCGWTYNGATSGNVFAYNYITNIQNTDYPTVVRPGLPAHGAHPMMNLFEGNYLNGPAISSDLYHGTSSHQTFFRNRQITDATKTGQTIGNVFMKGQTYTNMVGNVLGVVGFETLHETPDMYSGKAIYNFGAYGSWPPNDGKVAATILRHGNWDSVQNGQRWDPGIPDHVIPNSFYLTSKPSFFGNCMWPPFDPSGPTVTDIPAKRRYDGNPCGAGAGPGIPQGLQIE